MNNRTQLKPDHQINVIPVLFHVIPGLTRNPETGLDKAMHFSFNASMLNIETYCINKPLSGFPPARE
jgi:hypothetical protein